MKKVFIILGIIIILGAAVGGYFYYKKWFATKQQSPTTTSQLETKYYAGVMTGTPPATTDASKGENAAISSTDKVAAQTKNSIYDDAKPISIPASDSKASSVNNILQPALYNLYYKEARLIEVGTNRLVYTTYYSFSDQDIPYLASRLINAGYTIKDSSNQAVKATQPGEGALEINLNFESGTDGSFKIIVTF